MDEQQQHSMLNAKSKCGQIGDVMDKILSLVKRRGFIFRAFDIYGGFNGFFDYGPLGVELKRNIKNAWWHDMVTARHDVVGIDCSIISHPKVWEASGHLAGFSDPMVDCKESKMRFRADQLFFADVIVDGKSIGYVCVQESDDTLRDATAAAQQLKRKLSCPGNMEDLVLKCVQEATNDELTKIPSPVTGSIGVLTPPRDFNLMFQTHVGAVSDDTSVAYLRPETAQGIFVNFLNVVASTRVKIPFGIAQIGRSFRNEITPRNFVFRSREFEQMEMEFFIDDKEESWQHWHNYWVTERMKWHKSIGLPEDMLSIDVHKPEKLAHYSKACTDITFKYPFGIQELEGIAARGCFDLTQHQQYSGKSMEFFDETQHRKYIPHVIEPSVGVDRTVLAVLCAGYDEDEADGELRTVLRLSPRVAPVKVAVFPLVRNNEHIMKMANDIFQKLQRQYNIYFDASGAIGRRYRRMDEIGTPYCVTVDFESLDDNAFTLRHRDSMQQERIDMKDLLSILLENCY